MRLKRLLLLSVILATLSAGVFSVMPVNGDEHRHRNRHRERHENDDHNRSNLKPVADPTYKDKCGACHSPYQPELLPSASWRRILDCPDDHFGESFELDEQSRKTILDYVETNAAEHSAANLPVRIMRCLGKQVPMRISEIPYIKRKHHDIFPATIKRQSVGSLSNCTACHSRAHEGIYDDDFVVIPR